MTAKTKKTKKTIGASASWAANRCLRELWPHCLELSRAADRGDAGRVAASLLGARAVITEAINFMNRERGEPA